MRAIDLKDEPVSLSVTTDPKTGRVGFSDIPEQIIPALKKQYGERAIEAALAPGPVERAFFADLPEEEPQPARYLKLLESGELEARVRTLEANGELSREVPYFMAAINRSDEVILGRTGVLYFVCRKGCHFCQYRNFAERTLDAEGIAERMLALQKAGADNVQWLSPTAYTRTLVKALFLAAKEGFHLPIVHKSEGEDPLVDLTLLDGLVDVYVPDVKFIRPEFSKLIGLPPSYCERMKTALTEMVRQVGPLRRRPGSALLASRGVMARHLLMPTGVEEARHLLLFLQSLHPELPIHILGNYEPVHEAKSVPEIYRRVTGAEIAAVVQLAHSLEVRRVYVK